MNWCVVGFRNIRQGQIRLNTILFDLTAASSHGLSRPKLVQGRKWVMNGQTV